MLNIIINNIYLYIKDNDNKNRKSNSMIHNFWGFRYIIGRLKKTAENFGLKVRLIGEDYTSTYCSFCNTKGKRIRRGLFYCPRCSRVMNADVVGVLNIAGKDEVIIPSSTWDRDNGMLAHPLFLRVCSPLEARIPLTN